jgi:hypothetical protein
VASAGCSLGRPDNAVQSSPVTANDPFGSATKSCPRSTVSYAAARLTPVRARKIISGLQRVHPYASKPPAQSSLRS